MPRKYTESEGILGDLKESNLPRKYTEPVGRSEACEFVAVALNQWVAEWARYIGALPVITQSQVSSVCLEPLENQ